MLWETQEISLDTNVRKKFNWQEYNSELLPGDMEINEMLTLNKGKA
jgi:hypothetical protein